MGRGSRVGEQGARMTGGGKKIARVGIAAIAVGIGAGALWWARPGASPDPLAVARDAYDHGNWAGSEARAREVLNVRKDDSKALRLLARASARQGRDDSARRIYQRLGAGAMEPEDHLLLALILLREGRADAARNTLQFALQDDPDHAEARYELAKIELAEERFHGASRLAQNLDKNPLWKVRGGVLLGLVSDLLNDPSGAVAAFRSALNADRGLAGAVRTPDEARKLLARALLKTGKPAEAKGQIDAVLRSGPDAEASWLLSRAALQLGDEGTAAAALADSGRFGPDHPEAFEPAPYVGAARCAECHAEIHQSQQNSHHARTFLRAEELPESELPRGPVADPHLAGVAHALERRGAEVEAIATTGGKTLRALVRYVLGSGNHARTLVGVDREDGATRELRLSHFSRASSWDLTTGHVPHPEDPHGALGMRQSEDSLRACLNCHTTNFRATLDRTGPESLDRGIGCERCHGPGGNHVAAVTSGFPDPAIGRPRLASHSVVTNLCGQCHGVGDRKIPPDQEKFLLRFQATTLPRSRCATATKGAIGCVTCHDPHENAETSAASYEAKCLACHGPEGAETSKPSRRSHAAILPEGARRVACPVDAKQGCIGCHMPSRDGTMPHSPFTDHRIRIHRAKPGT